MKRQIQQFIILITLSFVLSACTSTGLKGVVESPEVKVKGVRLDKLTFTTAEAILSLNIKNPNAFMVPLRGLDYSLSLNSVSVAQGKLEKNLSIESHQSRMIEIPVSFKLLELIQTVPSIVRSRDFTYQLKGNTHFPFINIPFSRIGRVGQ
ncbi:MAG: LEA type 2 family protein [Thiotrichaceae bacterium]|nr:LEA type 2 family protein [Thiotrichaceae bacterium]